MKLEDWKAHDYPAPREMLAWEFYGAGFENVKLEKVAVPVPGKKEVLMRVDAVGLCFSDVKVIKAGESHPRLRGRDLKTDPTRGGHEVSLTLAAKGPGVPDSFVRGKRYLMQADVWFKGKNPAYGYAIPGGFAEYNLFGEETLFGDEGCYLIPLDERLGYVEAALIEPWSCVVGSYDVDYRDRPKEGGKALWVNCGGKLPEGSEFTRVAELFQLDAPLPETISQVSDDGLDDIVLSGTPEPELVQACYAALRREGVLCLLLDGPLGEVTVDVGRLHYHRVRIAGQHEGNALAAYAANLRKDILPGGRAHFAGAAGPMGQMHLQRALELDSPPAMVLATDVSDERLAYCERRLAPLAEKRGVEAHFVNPAKEGKAFEARALEVSGGGFDDVVVTAPVAALVPQALRLARHGCVVSIFAGLPLGTKVPLDLDLACRKSVKLFGSSGSRIKDMVTTYDRVREGGLDTNMSLAAIGGLRQAKEGLEGVAEGRYYGKVVVFPWLREFPLTRLPEMERLKGLGAGGVWTKEAEEEFFRSKIEPPKRQGRQGRQDTPLL